MQLISPSISLGTGKLQVMHLKRFWEKSMLKREGKLAGVNLQSEFQLDRILLFVLGLGLEQTTIYLFNRAPSFEDFEDWIIGTVGMPNERIVSKFNQALLGDLSAEPETIPNVLNAEQLDSWEKNGYLILKNAVPREDCDQVIAALCRHIGVDRDKPETWYNRHASQQGIMVQLFQHPYIQKNRESAVIRNAYEQLFNRTDLWCTADRVGFNPPETDTFKFPGPDLHWDVSLSQPIPFGLQGILYLADTASNQGAFTLVPGFHHRIGEWINALPAGVYPRSQDLHALGSLPIAAQAGDFIIWHQALPHGSSPNTAALPRFVQYINYEPLDQVFAEEWI